MDLLLIEPLGNSRLRLQYASAQWEIDSPIICSEEDDRLLRWYFEDFAERDPFQTSRAEEAQELISSYGQRLFQSLHIPQLDFAGKDLEIGILQDEERDILWEVLERQESWPPSVRPATVTVIRSVGRKTPEPVVENETQRRDVVNILVVIARPQFDRDIPHRFVSSTIVKVAEVTNGKVRVEIVRPGTFDAFKEHLGAKPGFFDVVHFDLHGQATHASATLSFLKKSQETGEITIDPRSAEEVAEVLIRCGVKHVVLNACRSATSRSSSNSNIATTLIRQGILTVLAMSYKIASSAVDQVVRTVYKGLLLEGLTLPRAAREARSAMATHPVKQTRFGISVEVMDYPVLRCFQTSFESTLPLIEDPTRVEPQLLDQILDTRQEIVGRENDILLLESKLLMDLNIGVLWGEPAMGKTSLVETAAEWWYKTFLIEDDLYFNLDVDDVESEFESTDMRDIETYLAARLLGSSDRAGEVVEYLNQHRLLIVVDHLEAWEMPPRNSPRAQRKLLKDFLAKVHGGRSLFILVSRRSEAWLENLTPQSANGKLTFSHLLLGLSTSRAVKFLVDEISTLRELPLSLDRVSSKYLEGLAEVSGGNPLALKMMAHDFCMKGVGIEDYFVALLQGSPVQQDFNALKADEGARIIRQLDKYCENCERKASEAWLAALLCRAVDPGKDLSEFITGDDLPLHPSVLAMFWHALPMDELGRYFLYYRLCMSLSTSGDGVAMRHFMDMMNHQFPQGINLENKKLEALGMSMEDCCRQVEAKDHAGSLKERIDNLIYDLKELHLLAMPYPDDPNAPHKLYYRVNPVLTIYLRATPHFERGRFALSEATAMLQTQSRFSFPFDRHYWSPVWTEARKQLGLMFFTDYGALLMALAQRPGQTILETAISTLIGSISRGLFLNPRRYELLALAFKRTLDRGLEALQNLVTEVLTDPEEASGTSFIEFANPGELIDDGVRLQFVLQALTAATAIRNGVFDSGGGLRTDTVSLLRPYVESSLGLLSSATKGGTGMIRMSIEYAWNTLILDPENQEHFWELRAKYYSWFSEELGDQFPHDQFKARQVPVWLNSLVLPTAPLHQVQDAVRVLRSQRRFESGREMLQTAMEKEMATGSDQARVRIGLLDCMVDLDRDEEKWEDAIIHLVQRNELEDSLPGRLTTKERILRESALAHLYGQAGDVATTRHLVRVILSRANGLHDADPELEVLSLIQVAQLPISRRVDWNVSAIFLYVRAMLTCARSPSYPDRFRDIIRTWTAVSKLNNETRPQWMLGPADTRPQSVAVFFLATMFGQLFSNLVNLSALASGSHIFQDSLTSQGIPKPETILEFAKAMLVMGRHMISNPRWEQDMWTDQAKERLVDVVQELAGRILRPVEWHAGSRYLDEVDLERQTAFFDYFNSVGESCLAGGVELRDDGSLSLPPTPWTPVTIWGTVGPEGVVAGTIAVPPDYTCPTRMIAYLAGYMIEEDEHS